MSDTDQTIPPALTPEEWKDERRICVYAAFWRDYGPDRVDVAPTAHSPHVSAIDTNDDLFALIALANAAINDTDPRKIRREHVEALESVGRLNPDILPGYGVPIHALASALAALLPPE